MYDFEMGCDVKKQCMSCDCDSCEIRTALWLYVMVAEWFSDHKQAYEDFSQFAGYRILE